MRGRPARALKTALFALLPACALLLGLSLLLDLLERKQLVQVVTPADRVLYLNGPLFEIEGDEDAPDARYVCRDLDMLRSSFAARKPADTFRIFVLGGSFAMGTPYAIQGSPGARIGGIDSWLAAELSRRLPSRRFEVINAAAGGQNSHRVRQIGEEVLHYQPDLLILAAGNNEGYLPPTRLHRYLHRWALYRGLLRLIAPLPQSGPSAVKHMPQDAPVEQIRWAFDRNISTLLRRARAARVPLALCTLPVNLRYQDPDPSNAQERTPIACLDRARELELSGRYGELVELLDGCTGYEAAYLRGRTLERLGRYDEARAAYLQAVELRPLSRCRPSLNAIVRSRAAEPGALLIDLEAAAQRSAPHGIPGYETFFDYCHMRWPGYAQMGRAACAALLDSGLIPLAAGEPLARPTVEELRQMIGLNDAYIKWIEDLSPLDMSIPETGPTDQENY